MEPAPGRPPLGDMFFPTRITLNEDNEYLSNVGLIILIRGSPSPDLPRLITEKLVNIHGGCTNDFTVMQATISPYLVICSNSHLRDSIVRRGIYAIPQSRVKFTIHEWRPRFGIGYDPPTHQAWIKIVGLPLQAWSEPEITAILCCFGHPMQILPFGQEAGHFRDITALIATKNLNQIPLAYTYREGDYATKIDIIILNSRPWDESYSPPQKTTTPLIPPNLRCAAKLAHQTSNLDHLSPRRLVLCQVSRRSIYPLGPPEAAT